SLVFWFSDFIIHRKGGYAILLCFKSCKVLYILREFNNLLYVAEEKSANMQRKEIVSSCEALDASWLKDVHVINRQVADGIDDVFRGPLLPV
ncbi:hypothetical protein ACTNCI_12415, partial [Mitsuokella jalaludinii]|uniref:hypothetical protein n=1 Tax=Mitsuokella jalaludinii TaxID=187979 RepID=UPI003F8AC186